MKFATALLVILLITALIMSSDLKRNDSLEPDEYSLHSHSSERLLNIMQQIHLNLESSQSDNDIVFSDENINDLIESVEELLFYAEIMTLKVPSSALDENNNVIFSAMASKLYDEALNIQTLTTSYDLKTMSYSEANLLNDSLNRLSQTCNACHQLFRRL